MSVVRHKAGCVPGSCPAYATNSLEVNERGWPTGNITGNRGPWAVILGSHLPYHVSAAWGPFTVYEEAVEFAKYVTAEIDPAFIAPLGSPARELLSWREMMLNPGGDHDKPR